MNLSGKSPDDLAQALLVRVYEANLIMRALAHTELDVGLDMVERDRPIDGKGYTEIHVSAGEWAYPPREPG